MDIIRNELEGLYPTPVNWPKESGAIDPILKTKYSRLENAISNFKGHLPSFFIKGFNAAWVKYYNAYGDTRCQCYHQYMPSEGVSIVNGKEIRHDNTKAYKETFKNNIDNLLKYAKQI